MSDMANVGMFTMGMVITHVLIFFAGVVATAVIALIHERRTKRQNCGVYCAGCQRKLNAATFSVDDGVPPGAVTVNSIRRRVGSTRVNLLGSADGQHPQLRR